jgi:hypothetical protein
MATTAKDRALVLIYRLDHRQVTLAKSEWIIHFLNDLSVWKKAEGGLSKKLLQIDPISLIQEYCRVGESER